MGKKAGQVASGGKGEKKRDTGGKTWYHVESDSKEGGGAVKYDPQDFKSVIFYMRQEFGARAGTGALFKKMEMRTKNLSKTNA